MVHSNAIHGGARAALLASLFVLAALPAVAAGTLDKAKNGKLTFGYAADMRPYSFADASGKPAGYGVELCAKVGEAIKADLKLATLTVDFVKVSPQDAFRAVDAGEVDLLCGAVPTLERRALVDFSIPIMLSGTTAVVNADAPPRLVHALAGQAPTGPAWRASPDQAPQRVKIAVVGGSAPEKSLATRLKERRIVAEMVPVKDTAAGLQLLASGEAHALVGDRAVLLEATKGGDSRVQVVDRLYGRDVVALAVHRDDSEFRLVVDRALSRIYRTSDEATIYSKYFGPATSGARDFFQLVALPE